MRPLFFILLMFSIFGCFRKKSAPKNVEAWLEEAFPGQFQVVVSNLKMLDIMARYRGEKRAVIADKADPEVQFLLDWIKGTPTLGLDTAQVQRLHERAKVDVAQARALFKLLENKGLEKFSVGVIENAAYIQVFWAPTPVAREQILTLLKNALDAQGEPVQTSIFVELMEPEAYHTTFQNIIPYGHWKTGAAWQREEQIMSIDFEWSKTLNPKKLLQGWALNPDSKRCGQYLDLAFREANAWAAQNLPKPFFMALSAPHTVEIPEKNGLSIRFGFPYFDQPLPTEEEAASVPKPKGYVCGVYDSEKQVFSGLRKAKEF